MLEADGGTSAGGSALDMENLLCEECRSSGVSRHRSREFGRKDRMVERPWMRDPKARHLTMASMEELGARGPRGVADRLFERVMREHEGGDFERAAFFIDMALQAYDAVPPEEIDADARFHVGLLRLLTGASGLAREQADEILAAHPDHLLGLLLAARAADFEDDAEGAEAFRARIRTRVEEAGEPRQMFEQPDSERFRQFLAGTLQ